MVDKDMATYSPCPCLNLEPTECSQHPCRCKACQPKSEKDKAGTCKWKLRHKLWLAENHVTSMDPLPEKMLKKFSGYNTPRQQHMLVLFYAKFRDRLLCNGVI